MKSAIRMARGPSSPVPYAAQMRAGYFSSAANYSRQSLMRAMETNGTVYGIVHLLSTAVSMPEWHLYRQQPQDGRRRYTTADQGDDQRTEVIQHQALKVWKRPNPFMTRTDLCEVSSQYLELVGESDWVVQTAGSVPTGLWPVRPDRLEPVPHPTQFLAGWIYTSPDGEKIPLNVSEVIQMKYPNPLDPYRGLGPVQAVLLDIDSMRYGREWNRNFFLNSAEPGGLITTEKKLSDKEFDELMLRWGEGHKGVNRAHRVGLLEGGAAWQDRHIAQKDMQFAELLNVSKDIIRQAFTIHKQMLGDSDDVNRASAQTAEEVFVAWQEIPRLNKLRTTLNVPYLELFGAAGQGVEFDYENPSPDDREADNAELLAKSQSANYLATPGVWEPDDILLAVGLPKMRKVQAVKAPPAPPALPAGEPAAEEAATEPPAGGDDAIANELAMILAGELPSLNGHKR